jgi:ubiquinone/menaquinone biosynthesis C-methylase UbiE
VLDVACGGGNWAIDMARGCPDMQITGLDISRPVVQAALNGARLERLDNIHFLVGDMHNMSAIADNSFDLVHARLLASDVSPRDWQPLLQEFLRVCRPGGRIIWTEMEYPITTSPAMDRLCNLIQQAIAHAGHTPHVTQIMDVMLADAPCRRVRRVTESFDFSVDTRGYTSLLHYLNYFLGLLQPFLEEMGVASTREIGCLCQEMIIDMYSDTFAASWPLVTVTGTKKMR